MTELSPRRSPIQTWWESKQPQWGSAGDASIVLRLHSNGAECSSAQTLGLCDLSSLTKLGVKGKEAEPWLSQQGIDLPAKIYDSRRLTDGGIVVRLGRDEFLLESGIENKSVPALELQLDSGRKHLYRIERQEATFLLVGSRAIEVAAQTCGVDLRKAIPGKLIYTRVAGVSCGIFPESIRSPEIIDDIPAFRIWVDCSYALYLWKTLLEICDDLDGYPIGAASLFPGLQ